MSLRLHEREDRDARGNLVRRRAPRAGRGAARARESTGARRPASNGRGSARRKMGSLHRPKVYAARASVTAGRRERLPVANREETCDEVEAHAHVAGGRVRGGWCALGRSACRRARRRRPPHRSRGRREGSAAQAPRFEVAMLWPKPMPNHWILGSSAGVAVDAQDHVFVLNIGDCVQRPHRNRRGREPAVPASAACRRRACSSTIRRAPSSATGAARPQATLAAAAQRPRDRQGRATCGSRAAGRTTRRS